MHAGHPPMDHLILVHAAQAGGGGDAKQGTVSAQVPPKPATTMPTETVGVSTSPCILTAQGYAKDS